VSALNDFGPALAIDSSIGTSVAVSNGERIVALSVDDPLGHAEVIATLIVDALREAGVTAGEITRVVAGMGPGPFTGLRVGIAAAQGFAAGRGVPVLPLISHEAAAFTAFAEDPARTEVFVVSDARRKEFFGTRFKAASHGKIPSLVHPPQLFSRAELGEAEQSRDLTRVDPVRMSAGALIELAALKHAANEPFEPLAALYLRSPDVTMPGAAKRVS